MIVDKFLAGLLGSALGVAVALAISRPAAQVDSNTLSETPLAAVCPKIEWPYGCDWHPEATLSPKHLSMHRISHDRSSLSIFR